MPRQQDWIALFGQQDAQRQARKRLIDELPADQRVKDLLIALDGLADDRTAPTERDGTLTLSVPIAVIAWKLGRSDKTAKHYIDLAGATPYLTVEARAHRPHTFRLHWLAIIDRQPATAGSNVRGCRNADSTRAASRPARDADSAAHARRSSPTEGGNQGGNLPPSFPPDLQTGLKKPVFCNENKRPVLKTGAAAGGSLPDGFWPWWRQQIAARDLSRPADVEQLYRLLVEAGILTASEQTRLQVHTQAVHDRQAARSPTAFFRENVPRARWWASAEAEDTARRIIARLDGHHIAEPQRPVITRPIEATPEPASWELPEDAPPYVRVAWERLQQRRQAKADEQQRVG